MNSQDPENKEGIGISDWVPDMNLVHWFSVVAVLLVIVVGAFFWRAHTGSDPKIEAQAPVTPGPSDDFMSLSLLEYVKRSLNPGPNESSWSKSSRINGARNILLSIGKDNKDYSVGGPI